MARRCATTRPRRSDAVSVLSDFGEVRDALAAELEAENSARLTAQNAAMVAAAMVEAKTREAERAAAEARTADEAREAALLPHFIGGARRTRDASENSREAASAKALEEAKFVAEARARQPDASSP